MCAKVLTAAFSCSPRPNGTSWWRRSPPSPLAQGKGIQRYFFSGAAEVEPDKQGRILIPQSLREHAGLEKDVTVIGAAVRAEIWDTARWNAYNESQTDEAIEASMNLLDF